MKKSLAMILVLVLLVGLVGIAPAFAADDAEDAPPKPAHIKDGVSVVSVFAAANVYPLDEREDVDPIKLDAILIYFSDNTFDQYVQTPSGYELFSTGTYSFKEDGDFILSENEDEDIVVVNVKQQYSMKERMLVDDQSSKEYKLGTIRYDQIFGPEDGREVEAIFADDYAVIYVDEDGVISKLDAVWIYFSDGTFAEYAYLNGEVIPFGGGTYELSENGDFHILPDEEDYGTITMTWEDSEGNFKGESLIFNLGTMGCRCIYEKQDPSVMPEAPAKAS